MNPTALAQLGPFLVKCGEGRVGWLYLDQAEPTPVVTTAIGCALFALADCLRLDWRNADGTKASDFAVQAAWLRVKGHPELAPRGGGAFVGLTSIRLSDAAIDQLVAQRAADFERDLVPQFPDFGLVPDAAQVGLMRLAWATGAADFDGSRGTPHRFPKFSAAFRARQWAVCADECALPQIAKTEPKANGLLRDLFLSLVPAA